MAFKFDVKKFALGILWSLVFVTIISVILSQYSDIPTLKTGGAFILIIISVFIMWIFVVSADGKIDKGEIFTMVMVAVGLVASAWALKNFFPEIFAAFPSELKQVFSALIE